MLLRLQLLARALRLPQPIKPITQFVQSDLGPCSAAAAAECFFGSGSFYVVYIAQMVLPFACVGTCVALYYGAELALRRMDPSGERRAAGAAAGGLVGWLEGLKIRQAGRCAGLACQQAWHFAV